MKIYAERYELNAQRGAPSEAQLNVVVKDGEEIGATILYSRRTPTEIRRQTEKTALFSDTNNINTGSCPKEETEGDAYQIYRAQCTEGISRGRTTSRNGPWTGQSMS